MKTIKNFINIHPKETGLVICSGHSIKSQKKEIDNFISKYKPITIGINNMNDFWIPKYHLWTNTKRFRNYGNKINKDSELLLGCNISIKIIKEVIGNRQYSLINYTDKEGIPVGYKKGKINGHFRTAGCLSIMILHLMGISNICVVGMDGHTLYDNDKNFHHCYEEDYKPFPKDIRISKDSLINKILNSLRTYGINFELITNTKYKEFYNGRIL